MGSLVMPSRRIMAPQFKTGDLLVLTGASAMKYGDRDFKPQALATFHMLILLILIIVHLS